MHEIIFKMNRNQNEKVDDNIMTTELKFGNQNIKESLISKRAPTDDFIYQELNFKFRPITCMYRKECVQFLSKFLEMKEELADEVKLMAQEEYEKIREAISLYNMFENHN